MTLHLDKKLFGELIEATAKNLSLPALYIEKDYWVTYILKKIAQSDYAETAIFKGGTSLSKAYKVIERFSEDIDLAVITKDKSNNQIKTLIKKIEKDILDENFIEIADHELVSKGSQFRKTMHSYPKIRDGDFGHAIENIILELSSFSRPHPYGEREISSYICDFLKEHSSEMVIKYELDPFLLNVLDYKRTFCEKISAIARASHESDSEHIKLKEKIRHLYDIHFLMKEENIQNFINSTEFEEMIGNVRDDDLKQFNKDWATIPLSSTEIFMNTSMVLVKLEEFYNTTFRDLVYTEELPSLNNEIKVSIENLAKILKEKKL